MMGAADAAMTATLDDVVRHHEICQLLYLKARLQDEHRFEAWEALWTDDAVYWIPANGDGDDPEREMSIVYDNRSRIGLRIRQFLTGKRFSQIPASRLRRVVGNVKVLGEEAGGTRVSANMLLAESHRHGQVLWAVRTEYLLRRVDGQWRMAFKTVAPVNNDTALTTMPFLA